MHLRLGGRLGPRRRPNPIVPAGAIALQAGRRLPAAPARRHWRSAASTGRWGRATDRSPPTTRQCWCRRRCDRRQPSRRDPPAATTTSPARRTLPSLRRCRRRRHGGNPFPRLTSQCLRFRSLSLRVWRLCEEHYPNNRRSSSRLSQIDVIRATSRSKSAQKVRPGVCR